MPDEDESRWRTYSLSASRVKTFQKCPRQYELKYIEGKPVTKQNKGYGALGALVHEAIENVLVEMLDVDQYDRSDLARRFKREFYDLEESGDYDMSIIDDRQREDGLDCLEMAAKYIAKVQPNIRDIEKESIYEISRFERNALGYMDVCTENEIWDWKTGRIRGEDTLRDEVIQGSMYVAAYHTEYGEMPEAVKFVYIKEGEVRTLDSSRDNWEQMIQYATPLINALDSGDFPARPEESKCYFCGYEQWCDAAPTSAGQIQEAIEENPEMWEAI